MKYAAYNVLFHKGKRITKTPYRNVTAKTRQGALTQSGKVNATWNKLMKNKHYKAKTVNV